MDGRDFKYSRSQKLIIIKSAQWITKNQHRIKTSSTINNNCSSRSSTTSTRASNLQWPSFRATSWIQTTCSKCKLNICPATRTNCSSSKALLRPRSPFRFLKRAKPRNLIKCASCRWDKATHRRPNRISNKWVRPWITALCIINKSSVLLGSPKTTFRSSKVKWCHKWNLSRCIKIKRILKCKT